MLAFPWIIAGAAVGMLVGPRMRATVFARSTGAGQSPRSVCPACSSQILPDRKRWRAMLPATGRCPMCRARIGPHPLLAEVTAGLAVAIVVACATSVWELAALAWLALIGVPLAFIDMAVLRLPDPLTATAFTGTLTLLTAAALAGHQPGHLARAAIGAAAITGFYLALWLVSPRGIGLGDAKLAASTGLVLGWTSWQALPTATVIAFALAGVYLGALVAIGQASRSSHVPLGSFILVGSLAAIVFLARTSVRATGLADSLRRSTTVAPHFG
jgi:leader peptidase (prepilin peptidase)/N-methyltransferase